MAIKRVALSALMLAAGLGGLTRANAASQQEMLAQTCFDRLADIAQFETAAEGEPSSDCPVSDLIRLQKIFVKDAVPITLAPPPTMRCELAETVSRWVRSDLSPLASTLGASLKTLRTTGSYQCRIRVGSGPGKISEHGKGNALDVNAITLSNGQSYSLVDTTLPEALREQLRASACRQFTTVLGPGSDATHNDHVHLDLLERSNGARMCQWDILSGATSDVPLPPRRPPP